MRSNRMRVIGAIALLGVASCSSRQDAPATTEGAAEGISAPNGTFLAYEHTVSFELSAGKIPARLAKSQASCVAQSFGDCAVLNIEQLAGDRPSASLTVRISPSGVEPFLAEAGEGGEIATRSLRAEDLASAVEDNAAERARLEKSLAKLSKFAERADLAVADAIAVANEAAEIEVQLEALARAGAGHKRRLDTNLVALGHLRVADGQYPTLSLSESGVGAMKASVAVTLYALPLAPKTKRAARAGGGATGSRAGASDAVPDYDDALFQRLRALRRRLASERGVPPYLIFGDRTLQELAAAKPTAVEQLRGIRGIGEVKLRDLGAVFVAEIAAALAEG